MARDAFGKLLCGATYNFTHLDLGVRLETSQEFLLSRREQVKCLREI